MIRNGTGRSAPNVTSADEKDAPDIKLIFVGPFPPPVHGQSLATAEFARIAKNYGILVRACDTSGGNNKGLRAIAHRIVSHLQAFMKLLVCSKGPAYISVNANAGAWATIFLICAARTRHRAIYLHHHTYGHIKSSSVIIQLMQILSAKTTTHIVLGDAMMVDLQKIIGAAARVAVVNNSGLIDSAPYDIEKTTKNSIILGHLSNLVADKGIQQVIDVAISALQSGLNIHLVVAGPINDGVAEAAIAEASSVLGERFTYLGAISGTEKRRFFEDVDIFVFPSRYRNEASPLVLFEAMAAGIPCIATDLGCIRDAIGDEGGVVVGRSSDFKQEALAFIQNVDGCLSAHRALARRRFEYLLEQHQQEIDQILQSMRKSC